MFRSPPNPVSESVPLLSGREAANARLAFIGAVDATSAFVQILVSDRELRTTLVPLIFVLVGLSLRPAVHTWARARGVPFGSKAEVKAQVQAWADAQSWATFALSFVLPYILLWMLYVAITLGGLDQPLWAMSPGKLLGAAIALTVGVLLTGVMKRGFSSSLFGYYL